MRKKKKNLDINLLEKLDIPIREINGHNISQIYKTLKETYKSKKSVILIANTIKGKGIKEIENNVKYSHHLPKMSILEKYI